MGVRWLCKHSVHGKKSLLPKGDLVDRLTGQNNGFGLGATEKKSGEGYCEVFTSRTTRQHDEGFLSYARQLFPNYNFFFFFFFNVYDFTDIDECKGNRSCHVNATCVNTLGSHVCQCHAGYTGNGRNCTDESKIFPTCTIFRTVLHVTFTYSTAPFSRVAGQLDNLFLITPFDLSSRFSG